MRLKAIICSIPFLMPIYADGEYEEKGGLQGSESEDMARSGVAHSGDHAKSESFSNK